MNNKESRKSPVFVKMQVEADSENFQKFISELLEENGVICDLRAYLRQHIVTLLNSANTGATPACQKNFKQRLQLSAQAINILIAEYLLHSEFSYTLSVFIAEIPLANMVFDLANDFISGADPSQLRFSNKDVWSILNFIGIKCDSNFVENVLNNYKTTESPLLVCILKNLFAFSDKDDLKVDTGILKEAPGKEEARSELLGEKIHKVQNNNKCEHILACKDCGSHILHWKEKYSEAKELLKNQATDDSVKIQDFLGTVDDVEENVLNEMFEDVRVVYETEVEKIRAVEEKHRQNLIYDHEALADAMRQEMEASFKAREAALESNVRAKKKFLWQLAQSLRTQHERVARAVRAVTVQSQTLREKEEALKAKLSKIEHLMKLRSENIHSQISSELSILEEKLELVKRERESVVKEKESLEEIKPTHACDHSCSEASSNYENLRRELSVLKKYIETVRAEPKSLIDRSTVTELDHLKTGEDLNNKQDIRTTKEENSQIRIKNRQVVNDFKKQKNVNFCVELTSMIANPEDSEGLERGAGIDVDAVQQLRQENERLREYGRQQELQVQRLAQSSAILRAELSFAQNQTRACNGAFTTHHTHVNQNIVRASCKGAGEDLGLFTPCAAQRVFLPGDTDPFIGLLRDKHSDYKRLLLNQWNKRRRASPLRAHRSPPRRSPERRAAHADEAGPSYEATDAPQESDRPPDAHTSQNTHNSSVTPKQGEQRSTFHNFINVDRTKSAKSVIREAKLKLRNHAKATSKLPSCSREKSPASVLREAKQKLRKLEIEAQAVEQSYLDYRNRQRAQANEAAAMGHSENDRRATLASNSNFHKMSLGMTENFDHYLSESIKKLSETRFGNRNTAIRNIKPIPPSFSEKPDHRVNDLLETPLAEFRRYYQVPPELPQKQSYQPNVSRVNADPQMTQNENPDRDLPNNYKSVDLELLQNNFQKNYNPPQKDNKTEQNKIEKSLLEDNKKNALRIEVEPLKGVGVINLKPESEKQENLVVMVQTKAPEVATYQANECKLCETVYEENKRTSSGRDHSRSLSPETTNTFRSFAENKLSPGRERSRSMSPEQAARLTKNDALEAIFHKDSLLVHSSAETRDGLDGKSKDADDLGMDVEQTYEDDFSAEDDNDNGQSSPVSLPASPRDDSFWNY